MDILNLLRAQWDRVLAWVALAVGALVLFLGFRGTSDAQHIVLQMPYVVSGGLGGLFLLGVAAMLWVSADLRDQWHEVNHLREAVEELAAQRDPVADAPTVVEAVPTNGEVAPATRPSGRRRKLTSEDGLVSSGR